MAAVAIAQKVLEADGNPFLTLSLAPELSPVTPETPLPEARRSYMRIAALIHPDKLKSQYDKATESFQMLVRAFEVFANPAERKKAAAADLKKTKQKAAATAKRVRKVSERSEKKLQVSRTKKTKKETKAKAKRRKRRDSDEDELESSEDDDTDDIESVSDDLEDEDVSEEEWDIDDFINSDKPPEVSVSRTLIGAPRVGGIYHRTTVKCPHCRTSWEPDTPAQYSLFMGKWGLKVHCQLCLFVFGSATAIHCCPRCDSPFEYDASMYDSNFRCHKCKTDIGFPYYPVNQAAIDKIAYDKWQEEQDRKRVKEREERRKSRYETGDGDQEKRDFLIGQCIIDSECPLCHKKVGSKHRTHVEGCLSAGLTGENPKNLSKKSPRMKNTKELLKPSKKPVPKRAKKQSKDPKEKASKK